MNNRFMRPRQRKPDAPGILTANQVDGLTWSRPSDNGAAITSYRVYGGGGLLGVVNGTETRWAVIPTPGLVLQVSAVNAVGESVFSRAIVAT